MIPTLEKASTPCREAAPKGAVLSGRRLLVVEDEPPISQLIQDVFRAEGCVMTCCGTAEEAAAVIEGKHFDALLSDLKLPGAGGQWLFDHLLEVHPALSRRVLFITGDTVSKSTVAFLERTGQPVLKKPFHVSELKAAVEELLSTRLAAMN